MFDIDSTDDDYSETLATAEALAERAEDLAWEDVSARSYSGRGMYGRSVIGFAVESDTGIAALAYAAAEAGIPFDVLPTRTDSLGSGIILY